MPLNFVETAVWRKNQAVLAQTHPALLALIHKTLRLGFPHLSHQVDKNGNPGFVVHHHDHTAPLKDDYATEEFQNVENAPTRNVAVFGVGTGHWLTRFHREHLESLHLLFLFEPDLAHLAFILTQTDVTLLLWDDRVYWLVGDAFAELKKYLGQAAVNIGSWGLTVYQHKESRTHCSAAFASFNTIIQNGVELASQNTLVQVQRGLFIQHNLLRNLLFMMRATPVGIVENALRNWPAIVIGAGPSLDRNVDALKEAPAGMLLVAVDTALQPLLSRGIQPHIVVTADPMKLNFRHFSAVDSLEPSLLAFMPETNYQILEKYSTHEKLVCLHDGESRTIQTLADALQIHGTFSRGMNVGYCAFSLARQLGCSPLILIGLDMALSDSGHTHAQQTANLSCIQYCKETGKSRLSGAVNDDNVSVLEVDGYFGGKVLTYPSFHQYILHLEAEIAKPAAPVIDATEGGAIKRGTIHMPLHEALATYAHHADLWATLHTLCQGQPNPNPSKLQMQLMHIYQHLQQAYRQLHQNSQRILQWFSLAGQTVPAKEEAQRQIEAYRTHWLHFLNNEPIHSAIDIGFAKWRYEAQKAYPPQDLSASELIQWWKPRFTEWFTGCQNDLKLFITIYAHTIQALQKQK